MAQPEPRRPSRRSALLMMGGAAAALALDGCAVRDEWPGITATGWAYRDRTPAEADRATLAALLGASPDALPPALLASLDATIRADFTTGNTVWMSGWLLSRTEARVAALWSTRRARPPG